MARMDEPAPNEDGWIDWRRIAKATRVACCDCGLVHDTEVTVKNGVPYIRIRRNNRSTANVRRHAKKGA